MRRRQLYLTLHPWWCDVLIALPLAGRRSQPAYSELTTWHSVSSTVICYKHAPQYIWQVSFLNLTPSGSSNVVSSLTPFSHILFSLINSLRPVSPLQSAYNGRISDCYFKSLKRLMKFFITFNVVFRVVILYNLIHKHCRFGVINILFK
jgi:hypothetical protein